MAFNRVPTQFMLAILCSLTTLSLQFHGNRNACTALSRRPHCVDGVLKKQCRDFPNLFRSFGLGSVEFGK